MSHGRLTATGKQGSWAVMKASNGPRFVVFCHGVRVLSSASVEGAWAEARARSGYDVSRWVVEERCKRCERWHESGIFCPSCEARRANEC